MVFTDPVISDLTRQEDFELDHYERCVAQPEITRTCRQIREEGLPIWYEMNFYLTATTSVHDANIIDKGRKRWLQAIGPINRSMLKHLYIDVEKQALLEEFFSLFDEEANLRVFYPKGKLLEMLRTESSAFDEHPDSKVMHISLVEGQRELGQWTWEDEAVASLSEKNG